MDTSKFIVLTSSNATVLHTYLCNRYIVIEEKKQLTFFLLEGVRHHGICSGNREQA